MVCWEEISNRTTNALHLNFPSLLFVPKFTETMRKYPIVPFLERKCCSDYELPASNGNETLTLAAGTGVYIPVLGLQHGSTYFPEPESFESDRFTEENIESRPIYTYIPFGDGPRMCLGKERPLRDVCKNFRFQSLKIKIMRFLPRCLSVW